MRVEAIFMKKLAIIITALSSLVFTSCSQSNPTPDKKEKYTISFNASLDDEHSEINYTFSYDFSAFNKSGTEFDKTTALLSLASIISSFSKTSMAAFFSKLSFGDVFYSEDYDLPDYKDSIKFSIASRDFNQFTLVYVNTDGVNYAKAWEGNFTIGDTGNSVGFQTCADKVLSGLDTYLNRYTEKPVKLWIAGYSRGGAIADIVASTLLDEEKISEDNMFTYTFEAAKGVALENVKEHKSIHNVINSGDVVTHIIPSKWGLSRVGTDIDIYNKKLDRFLKNLDSKIVLPSFTPSSKYATEKDFIDYLIDVVATKEFTSEDAHDLSTRENYATYYQNYVTYLFRLFFSIKQTTMNAIMTQISSMSFIQLSGLLAEDGVYNFLKPILDANSESYDDAMLKNSTNALVKYVTNVSDLVVLLATAESRDNVMRCGKVHYPEAVLALLINY